jgi:hypothetical protein
MESRKAKAEKELRHSLGGREPNPDAHTRGELQGGRKADAKSPNSDVANFSEKSLIDTWRPSPAVGGRGR